MVGASAGRKAETAVHRRRTGGNRGAIGEWGVHEGGNGEGGINGRAQWVQGGFTAGAGEADSRTGASSTGSADAAAELSVVFSLGAAAPPETLPAWGFMDIHQAFTGYPWYPRVMWQHRTTWGMHMLYSIMAMVVEPCNLASIL